MKPYMPSKVFICGAGHQGLSMAAHFALNGIDVSLWNRTKKKYSRDIGHAYYTLFRNYKW